MKSGKREIHVKAEDIITNVAKEKAEKCGIRFAAHEDIIPPSSNHRANNRTSLAGQANFVPYFLSRQENGYGWDQWMEEVQYAKVEFAQLIRCYDELEIRSHFEYERIIIKFSDRGDSPMDTYEAIRARRNVHKFRKQESSSGEIEKDSGGGSSSLICHEPATLGVHCGD